MSPIIIAVILLASVTLLILLLSYITYRMAFYQNPKKREIDPYRHVKNDGKPTSVFSKRLIDEILTVPYENIYITSHDGLKLRARLYMRGRGLPFAIQAHGYRSTPMLDFSGGGALAMEMGFNVIMIDERAHGESEGKTISFGYNESRDLLSWIEYVIKTYGADTEIMLYGISMGGATVLMASGLELPPNVKGIVADCPYTCAKDIIKEVISKKMGLPKSIFYPFVRLGGVLFGHFDPNLADARAAVERAKVPILIIHGESDTYVPPRMSLELFERNREIELHTFPDANHGLSFVYDYDRYQRIVYEFCAKCLSTNINNENVNNN